MAKKKEVIEEVLEEDAAENCVYELGFHLDPELAQQEVKTKYQEVRELIASVGTIVAEGEPTKIPLAYMISRGDTTGRRDFNNAFFCWIAYETGASGHEQIATMARENRSIVRFLDIRTSVEEAQHSAEMQEMFAQAAAMEAASLEEMEAEPAETTEAAVAPVEEVADDVAAV